MTREGTETPVSKQQALLARFTRDTEYYRDHYDELLAEHPEEWIAIFDETVVASDPDFEVLLDKLKRSGVPAHQALVKPLTRNENILIVVSR